MLTKEERANPGTTMEEALKHFGVRRREGEILHLWDDLKKLQELNPCLALADFSKKFQVVIDYDPEYKTAIIRVL